MSDVEEVKVEKPKGEKPRGEKGEKGKGGKGEKGAPKAEAAEPRQPAVPSEPAPPARLREHYVQHVRPALTRAFGLTNPHQIPRLLKIVLNVGFGGSQKAPKALDAMVSEMSLIAGQKAMVTRAKKAISNFSLRQGMPIGATVTLRGAHMYEFLDRFISIAVPRIRDFRGLPTKSFDGRGNYTFGIKEQMIFPEIDYDKVERIHGMDITIVTNAKRDDLAMALLREMGMPFHGVSPVVVG